MITIEELSQGLKDYLNTLGLTEEQVRSLMLSMIGNIGDLQTENKDNIVNAINEVFQSANNGKELIANAIGSPLSSEDTFNAMSDKINVIKNNIRNILVKRDMVIAEDISINDIIHLIDDNMTFSRVVSGTDVSSAATGSFGFVPKTLSLLTTTGTNLNTFITSLPHALTTFLFRTCITGGSNNNKELIIDVKIEIVDSADRVKKTYNRTIDVYKNSTTNYDITVNSIDVDNTDKFKIYIGNPYASSYDSNRIEVISYFMYSIKTN